MYGSFASLKRRVGEAVSAAYPDDGQAVITGRRKAARLRTSIPASLIALSGTKRCVLLDISQTGAQISLAKPLREGDSGFLQFARMEAFGCVVRHSEGVNGLEFDVALTQEDILAVRQFAENFDREESRALREEARAWVLGLD